MMEKQKGLFILLFCVVVPTLDQITDIRMVLRLMHGPEDGFQINSGKSFTLRIIWTTPYTGLCCYISITSGLYKFLGNLVQAGLHQYHQRGATQQSPSIEACPVHPPSRNSWVQTSSHWSPMYTKIFNALCPIFVSLWILKKLYKFCQFLYKDKIGILPPFIHISCLPETSPNYGTNHLPIPPPIRPWSLRAKETEIFCWNLPFGRNSFSS